MTFEAHTDADIRTIVRLVLNRLDYDRNDWIATRLLCAIFSDSELVAMIVYGPKKSGGKV